MSKAQLGIVLSRLKGFIQPKVRTEQYLTNPEIAADMIYGAYMAGYIDGKIIADFGAGNGILGLGAALMGAGKTYLIESESKAIGIINKNMDLLKSELGDLFDQNKVVIFEGDVEKFSEKVDLILQNPPFGTKKEHADKEFLAKAFELAGNVYTLHKTSTREFIIEFAFKNNFILKEAVDYRFRLKKSMGYHIKPSKIIEVTLFKFTRIKK